MPSEPLSNESYRAVDFVTESKLPKEGCFPRDKTTAEDLLPKDAANSMWAQVAPAEQGGVDNSDKSRQSADMGRSVHNRADR